MPKKDKVTLRYRGEGSPVKMSLPDGTDIVLSAGTTFELEEKEAKQLLVQYCGDDEKGNAIYRDDPRFERVM